MRSEEDEVEERGEVEPNLHHGGTENSGERSGGRVIGKTFYHRGHRGTQR